MWVLFEKDENKNENFITRKGKSMKKVLKRKRGLHESYERADHSFEYNDVVEDLVDRAKSWIDDGHSQQEAIEGAIDDGLIYDADIWAVIKEYYRPSECGDAFYGALDYLTGDMMSILEETEGYEEVYGESFRKPIRNRIRR